MNSRGKCLAAEGILKLQDASQHHQRNYQEKKNPVVEEYSRIAQYNIEWSFYVETTRKRWARSSSSRLS